jgi:valyl-tRNA synthetase
MATPHRLTETTGSGGVQEVEYSEEPGKLYYFKYHVVGGTRYTRTLLE